MPQSIGTVETRSLVGAIEAADAMLKAARVQILDFSLVGSGLIAVVVSGEVAAVQAAVDSGWAAAEKVAEVVSRNVIANPHNDIGKLMGNEVSEDGK